MIDSIRRARLWWIVIVVAVLSVAGGSASAQELQVTPGEEPGRYLIAVDGQEPMEISLAVEGPPEEEGSSYSYCRTREDFSLIVARVGEAEQTGELVVPIGSPYKIGRVRAVKNGDRVLMAIDLSYSCSSRGSENHSRRWVAVELVGGLRLVLNAQSQGPYCYGNHFFEPATEIKPSWQIRGDQLWMSLPVRNFHCNKWNAAEDRGQIDWQVGELPSGRVPAFPKRLAVVVDEALELGYLPYAAVNFASGLMGVLAEVPTSMGAPRLLGIADRKGRSALVFLPRFGYEPSLLARAASPLDSYLRKYTSPARHYEDEWPQLTRTGAFQYSEEFLSARTRPSTTRLLHNKGVVISVLSMPCVDAVDLLATGAASERWLLRVDRAEEDLEVQAVLVESCSFGFSTFRGMQEYRLPPGDLSISGDSVRLTHRPPQLDVETLAKDKFLFFALSDLNKLHSTAAVVMRLDGPTVSISRCDPALPTSGRGWFARESGVCMVNVRFFVRRGRWKYPQDQVPPRFIVPPAIAGWCSEAGEQSEWRSFNATVGEDGTISGLSSRRSDGPVPAEIVADIGRWRIEPAKNAAGEPISVTMTIEVARGRTRSDLPSVCE